VAARILIVSIVGAACLMHAPSAGAVSAQGCAPPPPPVRDIALPRYYADADGSIVDPDLLAKHRGRVEPLAAFLRGVASMADKAVKRPSPGSRSEIGRCAVAWLRHWAAHGAWLGRMGSKQAEYQRKWDLAGAALAYLKVRSFATADDRAVIEPWLTQWADAARAFFDDPARQRNNHWYWLGLGLGAVGIACDSPRHWDAARAIMHDAARDIAADGSLAHEMTRKGRALFYHAFAAMPLVVLARLAEAKGEDFYAAGGGALHRLVRLTLQGMADPAAFDARAGSPQQRPLKAGAGWFQLYAERFPDRAHPRAEMAASHRWLGGDVTLLGKALAR
jgi:poly(beta-D-mannuronate) lyase